MLLCVVAFANLSSCSKDNESNENLIVGKWECIYNSSGGNTGYIWEFKSNGTMTSSEPNGPSNVEYSVQNDVLILANVPAWTIDELSSSSLKLTSRAINNLQRHFKKIE